MIYNCKTYISKRVNNLLPCRCGEEARIFTKKYVPCSRRVGKKSSEYWVRCTDMNCMCSMNDYFSSDKKEDVIKVWNRRARYR